MVGCFFIWRPPWSLAPEAIFDRNRASKSLNFVGFPKGFRDLKISQDKKKITGIGGIIYKLVQKIIPPQKKIQLRASDQDFFAFLPSDLTHKRPASKRPKRTFERFRSGWGWDSVLWMSPDQRLRFWALHHRTNGILGIGKILPRYWSVWCITFWEAQTTSRSW